MVPRGFPQAAFPLVVAHRGASGLHAENTLPAFEAALEAGAQAVEADIRLTADGVPVVLHDPDVSRVTDGEGLVHELTLRDLKRLDASMGRGPRAEVPTLREVLDLVSGRAGVDLEIKNIPWEPSFDSPREAIVEATVRELEASSFDGPVLISSFNPVSIRRARELAPEIPTGFLTIATVDPVSALDQAAEGGHAFVIPNVDAVLRAGRGFVGRAHEAGVLVGTWTVDDPNTLGTLFHWGVDAVATNFPDRALHVRARWRFHRVVEEVERAKEAVVQAVPPSARLPGRPLAEALMEFEAALRDAERAMSGWLRREVAAEWEACRDGLAESLRLAEDLRLAAPALDFEGLVGVVADLIAPLEAFERAADRLR